MWLIDVFLDNSGALWHSGRGYIRLAHKIVVSGSIHCWFGPAHHNCCWIGKINNIAWIMAACYIIVWRECNQLPTPLITVKKHCEIKAGRGRSAATERSPFKKHYSEVYFKLRRITPGNTLFRVKASLVFNLKRGEMALCSINWQYDWSKPHWSKPVVKTF